jgi:signal transduction histidine kinase
MAKSHAQQDLIVQLAHELREPLAALRGAMEVLRRGGGEPDVRSWVCESFDRQTSQMSRLIDDILTVSSEHRGQIKLHKRLVDLETTVKGAIETTSPSLTRRAHTVAVSMPAGPLTIHVDPNGLVQVLTNLLANASKFTQPGGRIELRATLEADALVLCLSDNGMGISSRDLPHVFERFWQSSRNDASAAGGMGIGLAVVRQVVEAHGGTIDATSAGPGRGSTFIGRFPQEMWAVSAAPDFPVQPATTPSAVQER